MESVVALEEAVTAVQGKVEQDNSFRVRESEESGIYSSEASSSLNTDWEFYENEVLDASVFSLPDYIQSSNLKSERPDPEFSSISDAATVPNGQGENLYSGSKRHIHFRPNRVNSH